MNPSNTTIALTQQERKGSPWTIFLWFPVILLIALILQTLYIIGFGWIDALIGGIPSWLVVPIELSSGIVFILATWFVAGTIEERSLKSLGFHRLMTKGLYIKGWLIGIVLVLVVYGLNVLLARVTSQWNQWHTLAMILYVVGFAIQGLGEEVLCRGYLMNNISSYWGPVWGIVLNSLLFSLLHFFNPAVSFIALLNVFLAGVLFSVIFYYNDSIWFVGAIHSAWNFMLGPVLGIPVSGNVLPSAWFITRLPKKTVLWHGGDFGFEGGLVATIVLLIATLSIVYYYEKHQKSTRL